VATAGYRHSQASQGCRLASTTIAAMCSGQSLCLVATTHHRLSLFVAFVGSASGHGGYHPAQASQSCRLVCLHVVVIARYGNTLRFYITPHCIKCMPSQSPSSFGGHAPLSRPIGFTQQALCKVAYAGYGRQLSALPGRYAPYAPPPVALWVCLHGGFVQALCAVLSVSGFAVSFVLAPAHPWRSLASQASPARSARPPPKGAPSEPRKKHPLTIGVVNLSSRHQIR
jgi:hypothetical protein